MGGPRISMREGKWGKRGAVNLGFSRTKRIMVEEFGGRLKKRGRV